MVFSIAEVRVTADSGFDVVPANRELAGAEVELVNELARETRLKGALAALEAGRTRERVVDVGEGY